MPLAEETEMTGSEIDTFLGRHETGVLALADGNHPYAIPISYGYDADERAFYMRLVSSPGGEKDRFLDASTEGRIVVYEEGESGRTYRSVVATGAIVEIEPDELTVEQIEQYGDAKRPLFEIWGEPTDELDIRLYRFDPADLSGRYTELDRDAK